MAIQHTHKTSSFLSKKFPIMLVCDGVESPSNIGSLFRICDAFGVSEIIFCNSDLNIKSPRLQKTARSTQNRVAYSNSSDIIETIVELNKNDFTTVALEITDSSISLEKLFLEKDQKIALIIGNEQQGVSEKVLQLVEKTTHIEMYGENSSMNVVQATSIALHSIINKLYIY